jgi:hypothetical protein
MGVMAKKLQPNWQQQGTCWVHYTTSDAGQTPTLIIPPMPLLVVKIELDVRTETWHLACHLAFNFQVGFCHKKNAHM